MRFHQESDRQGQHSSSQKLEASTPIHLTLDNFESVDQGFIWAAITKLTDANITIEPSTDWGRDLDGAKITLNEYLDRWLAANALTVERICIAAISPPRFRSKRQLPGVDELPI